MSEIKRYVVEIGDRGPGTVRLDYVERADGEFVRFVDHERDLQEKVSEIDMLRALLAWGSDRCVYCTLPAQDFARCRLGFPGCGRMDDRMSRPELRNWSKGPA